ncbi:hypothetical protein ACQKWADRAFT_282061 [Trichoderma austrokoningii]
MQESRNFSQNALGDNARVYLGDNHVTVNTTAPDANKLFLQEISQTDPIYDRKDILMRKGPLLRDSCRWILGHEDFKRWYCGEESGVLWIKGDPGKGKTMLLCGILDELEAFEEFERLGRKRSLSEEFEKLQGSEKFSKLQDFEKFSKLEMPERLEIFKEMETPNWFRIDSHGPNSATFFCQATDYRASTAAAVIRGLIYSLLQQVDASLLTSIREKYGDRLKGYLGGDKALAMLCDLFETIVWRRISMNLSSICVVDALDECIEDSDHLLNLIVRTKDMVKWLVSSRNEKNIERKLARTSQMLELELEGNAKHVSASVDIFINHHIREITAIQDDKALQYTTSYILKTKASGTFLWAALMIEQLHNIDHWEVADTLEEMPKGLGGIYDLALDRIGKLRDRPREACRVLLSIAAAAKRPLRLMELLVFINGHWTGEGRFKSTYQLRDVRDMTNSCGSILSIRDETVYFVHQSAKDYLVRAAAERIFSIQHQHYKMFETSLHAMSGILTYDIYNVKDPKTHIDKILPKDVESGPLASLEYCCVFWVEHLIKGFEHFKNSQKLYSFLVDKFLCWIESLALMRGYISHALPALEKLKEAVDGNCQGIISEPLMRLQIEYLRHFLNDACRFVTHSTTWVPHWPLQLYFLAIESEPGDSFIKTAFRRTVRDRFGLMPAAFNISLSQQPSLPPRIITFPRLHDDSIHHHYLTVSGDWYSQPRGSKRPIITSWVIKKGREEGDAGVSENSYMEAKESMKNNNNNNTGADIEDGRGFFAHSDHFMLVPREDVFQDRRVNSAFPCAALDLSRGPYQGLDLRAGSAFVQYHAYETKRSLWPGSDMTCGDIFDWINTNKNV